MDSYSIFTVCTQDYRDASDFSMDSWLATTARHIYVYTDDPTWVAKTDRVSILPITSRMMTRTRRRRNRQLRKSRSTFASYVWLMHVGLKALAFQRVLDETSGENVVFLDADCYVLSDIQDVFEQDFDLAVVRFLEGITISSGVWFSRNNQNTKYFSSHWLKKQDEFKNAGFGSFRQSSYSQNAFDSVLRRAYEDGVCRILKLPFDMYSLKVKDCSELPADKALRVKNLLLENLRKKPKILHFYNNSYRNEQLKNEVFEALEEIELIRNKQRGE